MADETHQETKSPTGDVVYDEDALRDAAKKMHVSDEEPNREPDPTHDHDDEALQEAAERMHTQH